MIQRKLRVEINHLASLLPSQVVGFVGWVNHPMDKLRLNADILLIFRRRFSDIAAV